VAKCKMCGRKSLFLKIDERGNCINCQIEVDTEETHKKLESLKLELQNEADTYALLKDKAESEIFEKTKADIESMKQKAEHDTEHLHLLIVSQNKELDKLNREIDSKRRLVIQLDDAMLYQEFGLYEPKFDFCNAEQYKERLKRIREEQKACIRNDRAMLGSATWTVNDSLSKGKKLVKDMQKLFLKAFNSECDALVEKVKYQNFDAFAERMRKSCDSISKLGKIMSISITSEYLSLKLQELALSHEYQLKKQEEKEAQREAREQLREEKKLQKEIEESRKKLNKEKIHYSNELAHLKEQLLSAEDEQKESIAEKIGEIENSLLDIDKSIQDVDYREANQRAGYVYVISNIGSFGEGVYKIGMTRRLDPYERIYELSGASVPFNFDVHAMIFTDDAPGLEAALHRAFEPFKVNLVNQRREFFKVSLEQIKGEVRKNHDKIVEFFELPEAEQYRLSQKMRTEGRVVQ